MCLFFSLLMFGPRIAAVLFWLFQPTRFGLTFSSFIWPLLGVIFLPLTTIVYVLSFPLGITGWEWFWIIMAFIVDIASYAGTGYNKDKIQNYKMQK